MIVENGELSEADRSIISAGFRQHSEMVNAPPFEQEEKNWLIRDDETLLIAALTANVLWDWIYIDELWVCQSRRGTGLGKTLMEAVENDARSRSLSGLWLWTQSWQAEGFYLNLGYTEFARFKNFPMGHDRIGFRKELGADGEGK